MAIKFITGDCLELMREMPDDSVDLVFCSPPYEAARTYGIDFVLRGQDWVDWCVERYVECVRVSKGAVCWVVEGQTRQFRWSAAPVLLMADLHRAGISLRKPPAFHRVGIPGSGGPDWLRNDYEFIVCSTKGKLSWSDNTACAKPCVYGPGGDPSHRKTNGERVNRRREPGDEDVQSRRKASGVRLRDGVYKEPKLANPGNVIHCKVGGGLMGHKLAHENEAPFPEQLPTFFIRSFCPPDGTVLDPFSGSGTTVCCAEKCGRNGIGIDIRQCQTDLGLRRLEDVQKELCQ